MDAEEILKLFDSYWFGHKIISKNPPSSPPTDPVLQIQEEQPLIPEISRLPSLHTRSLSDQFLSSKTSFKPDSISPNSVLLPPKLQTILSGKEVEEVTDRRTDQEVVEIASKKVMGRRRKTGSSKSLSDLEFEELKGFMDLGFVFSEEDKDSRLVSIIPGLQRFGKKAVGEEEIFDESTVSRPYLSEAWAGFDRRKDEKPLMNWIIPALGDEIDMKDHLKFWAHSVASTVR
ncbi:hypothetical protein HHK36_001706 [Tetracentron sinense]|uniref:Uncharacterized protein n=1 Tax=Tetracentron sinense TaxID=13715 RepID=A0A834ZT95_TETSI|nr:hypothetical protein HHK36_001706 [Tetracentron sinense]